MAVTIKDIAKVAGVSHTTVSRALRGHSAISAATTARIQKLAQEMGYVPSAVAQSLLSRQTYTIGMVITTIADPFVSHVVNGAEQTAQKAGYSLFLAISHNDPEKEIAVVETLQRRRVDAIIVTSSRVGSLYSDQLEKIQVPIVLINNQEEGEYLYSVSIDDVQGARLAVEHLISLGHHRIGYVTTAHRPKSNGQRLFGYQAVLEEAGISTDPGLIFSENCDDDFVCGQAALSFCLKHQITAVFCYNDVTAIGLLTACRQKGIAVPENLSIIGFDDIDATLFVMPPLTTIRQPRYSLGEIAMTMILNLLDGRDVQDKVLPCQLIVRESTSPI